MDDEIIGTCPHGLKRCPICETDPIETIARLNAEIERLRADNERLRAALRDIADAYAEPLDEDKERDLLDEAINAMAQTSVNILIDARRSIKWWPYSRSLVVNVDGVDVLDVHEKHIVSAVSAYEER